MQGIMFDRIQSLEKSRTNWRMKVRLSRMWPTTSPDTRTVKGYNLILLDDDNSHVHAYVYPDNWHNIGNGVVEGNVYIIENFQVRDTIGRLKPVSTNFCIRLLNETKIVAVENDPLIPVHKFELMDLGDLFQECNKYATDENPEFAIDVIGVIEKFEKAKPITTKFGQREIVRFKINDGSVSHKVSVWGDLARTVNENYEKQVDKRVIAIITSTKLTLFRNEVQIATLPSSKIYLNLDIDPVNEFRERLEEEGYKSEEGSCEVIEVLPNQSFIPTVSLKELNENTAAYFVKKCVVVTFKISKFEDEENWWYNSCNKCHDEVEKIDKKYKCDECKRNFPYAEKRFRIFVLAEDNTFSCNVILMDRVVKHIVATTATNLINENKKAASNSVMPTILKIIVGKEITVKIKLSEANINGDSNIYEAVDLYDTSMIATKVPDNSPIPKSPSFSQAVMLDGIELFETPGSSKSVTKKIKKEP